MSDLSRVVFLAAPPFNIRIFRSAVRGEELQSLLKGSIEAVPNNVAPLWMDDEVRTLLHQQSCVSQVNGGIKQQLTKEVLHYSYYLSYFDIFVSSRTPSLTHMISVLTGVFCSDLNVSSILRLQLLAVFRFAMLILAYAACKLRHWWVIAVSSSSFLTLCQQMALLENSVKCSRLPSPHFILRCFVCVVY